MTQTILDLAAQLTDDELIGRIRQLSRAERETTVELVAHLAELETRGLHLAQGYGSLFSYCREALHLSEHAAYNRIEAARASRRFPLVLDRLADGSINLSTVRLLAPHLTPANFLRVLDEAAGKSKRDVEGLVARLAPRPDVPASVRRLPPPGPIVQVTAARVLADVADVVTRGAGASAPVPSIQAAGETAALTGGGRGGSSYGPAAADAVELAGIGAFDGSSEAGRAPACAGPPPFTSAAGRHVVAPLSPERFRVQFTIGAEAHEDLRRAQELLRRELPDGDPGAIFERALKLLLEDVARKKLAATAQPRPVRPTAAGSRHVPAHVKRAVWLRDAGRCAFVARGGRRCREHAFLELHHVEPYAIGGETTAANLSLRCRAHNAHEARLVFGHELHRADRSANSPRGESRARPVVGNGHQEPGPMPAAASS